LSYIYADLKADDPRVMAVKEWLKPITRWKRTLGWGRPGCFYYYHTMTKALTASGTGALESADTKQANWRQDLAFEIDATATT